MDLRLTPLTTPSSLSSLRGAQTLGGAGPSNRANALGEAQGGFGDALRTALHNVSKAQETASELQTQVQLGNPSVSLEQTMLAMQKAQIGFQAALHVRNRMMQAYTDVMNMQV